jgi:hypothetical protein
MVQPEGFVQKGKEGQVYRLKKALYGLKQASLAWYKQADKSLKLLGFRRCYSDSGIYARVDTHITVCVLYVDDILFMGSDTSLIKYIKTSFMKMWECRDLGDVKEYLAMKITRDRANKTLIIDQNAYALKVVQRFGQQNCKPTGVVLPSGYQKDLQVNQGQCTSEQRTYYQSVIGSLLYLALGTRPDICFSVIFMSQFSVNPSERHINLALHIVRYVASTLDAKIIYQGTRTLLHGDGNGIIAYADADWGSNPINRRSVTGHLVKLAHGAVTWVSTSQKTSAHSSTEAEYMALSDCARQVSWVRSLFWEIGYQVDQVDVCGDNQGALFLAENPSVDKRTKHIDIRYHYIKDCVEDKKIRLWFVPTYVQTADILTKNLPTPALNKLRLRLGLHCRDTR